MDKMKKVIQILAWIANLLAAVLAIMEHLDKAKWERGESPNLIIILSHRGQNENKFLDSNRDYYRGYYRECLVGVQIMKKKQKENDENDKKV